jgi:type I site-specific restriction-modification system R (restriction) subunit
MDGQGNAMLVAGSIYEACKFYELFAKTELKGKCAIVTSYMPTTTDAKGEATGEGETDNLRKYQAYRQMLADWFNEPEDVAAGKAELFEKQAKKRFIEQPGQLKLLIVVDKLLTGFDSPPATYLYIDKKMQDHGLFQAICRVNRLDGEDKPYGYIIDYKDLFKPLEGAVRDYTSGAFDAFDEDDVKGLPKDRLASGDYIDLKAFEPAMRYLIDAYIRAEESEKISAFDDLSLIQLIVDRGAAAIDVLPASIRKNQTAVAETIENNVRRLIVKESPVDPAYYEKMSKLLDALIVQRRQGVIDFKKYLDEIAALTKAATTPGGAPATYPPAIDTAAKRALYNNLGKDGTLAVAVDDGICKSVQDGWRSNSMKLKRVRRAIQSVLTTHASRLVEPDDDALHSIPPGSLGVPEGLIDETTDKVLERAKNQHEY